MPLPSMASVSPSRATATEIRRVVFNAAGAEALRQAVRADGVGHARCCGLLHRVSAEMRVTRCAPQLGVPKELGNHRQALAERERAARKVVPEVMEPGVVELRPRADAQPVVVHPPPRPAARDHPRIAGQARHRCENLSRRWRERDHARTRFGSG